MALKIKVGFIGFGKMGSALAKGAVASRLLAARQIFVTDPSFEAQRAARKNRFSISKSFGDLLKKADLFILAVKPQKLSAVLSELQRAHGQRFLRRKVFVSIAAGVPIKKIERGLGNHVSVLRVMPNTPALLKTGMAAISRGRHASPVHRNWVKKIFESVGEVALVNDNKMDAITAVSGSGPAYVFYLAESMIQAAQKLGLQKSLARQLVHQTIFGSGKMLATLPDEAGQLRKAVTSPGGTTEAALKDFDRNQLRRLLGRGVLKAAKRSKELSKL